MYLRISPLLILVFFCFLFIIHNPSFTFSINLPDSYSNCFPVDTNPVHYRCFDNNLPVQNPVFSLPHTPSYSPPKPRKRAFSFGRINTIATLFIILITLLNVIVYKLRQLQESNSGEKLTLSSSLPTEQLCRQFSLSEIISATHNFDESLVIGQGGFGKVYKGVVDNGANTVAIKRLNSLSKQGADEFWTEISMLSKFRHSHLVSLLGYCDNYSEMILVYEYMVNGTLADHLHKLVKKGVCNTPLYWVQRLEICIDSARGLDYLHTGTGIRHRVIHRDVKSTNILLDENWAAKISDFGMSKIGPANQSCTHISTHVKGTFGYLDPEYFLTRRLTRKSDVYSFGVVLLEVLCGRPAVDSSLHEDQRGLVRWAQNCIKEGKVDEIVDPTIRLQIQSNCLSAFVQIADQCLDNLPKKRPTMAEVVAWLEFALSLQEKGDSNSSMLNDSVFNAFDTVTESQESESSFPYKEIVTGDSFENDDGNGVNGGENGAESSVKPITVRGKNGSSSVTNPVKRITFTKKVQLLFVSARHVRSDPKPLNDDRNSKKNLAGTNALPNKNEETVQLVPPSRYLATPNPVKGSQAKKAHTGSKNIGKNNTLANQDEVFVSQTPLSGKIVEQTLKLFTYAELKKATSNFRPNRLLGEGGFGKVFKGWINEKTFSPTKPNVDIPIAVKTLQLNGFQGFEEWRSELQILGRYIHPNIVKLLGYCSEDNHMLLIVYEYMPKGSLEKYIFTSAEDTEPLSWSTRLKIATGAAKALAFLHSAEKQVIYRDFKASNILLDDDFSPKLSDFGLAKLGPAENNTHISTRVMGTYGYAAPEYVATGHLYVKSDVYGFGVVLLELLTGLRALDKKRSPTKRDLIKYAQPLLGKKRNLKSLVDTRLKLNYPPNGALGLAKLALRCLEVSHQDRPSMREVVEILDQLQHI